jgi:myo-inositol-1(or 4)-monophosphatase
MPSPFTVAAQPDAPADVPKLEAMLRTAVAAAEEAGALLRERVDGFIEFRGKGENGDVVSELDVEAERLIVRRLREDYPDIPVLAEESGLLEAARSGHSPWLWLVDPLDGTNNLAIGLPAYVVGVALCRNGEPVVSAVHEPHSGRTWRAYRGSGLLGPDGQQAARRPRTGDRGARKPVVAWTQGYAVRGTDPVAGAVKAVLESRARRVLPLWAPLLGWAMLARGDIDAFVGYRPELIDLPGGLLLAREAGMKVRTLDGGAFDARFDQYAARSDVDLSFVCAPPELMPEVLEWTRLAGRLAPKLAHAFESC